MSTRPNEYLYLVASAFPEIPHLEIAFSFKRSDIERGTIMGASQEE